MNGDKQKISIDFVANTDFVNYIKEAKKDEDLHFLETGINLRINHNKFGRRLDYIFLSIPDFLEQLNNKTEKEIIDFHGADDPVNYLFIPSKDNVLEIIIEDRRSEKKKIGETTRSELIKETIRFAEEFIKTLKRINKKTLEFEPVKNIIKLKNNLKIKMNIG